MGHCNKMWALKYGGILERGHRCAYNTPHRSEHQTLQEMPIIIIGLRNDFPVGCAAFLRATIPPPYPPCTKPKNNKFKNRADFTTGTIVLVENTTKFCWVFNTCNAKSMLVHILDQKIEIFIKKS